MNNLQKDMASHYKVLAPLLIVALMLTSVAPLMPLRAQETTPEEPQQEIEQAQPEEQKSETEHTEEQTTENEGEEGQDGEDGEPIEEEDPAQDGEDGELSEDGEEGEEGEKGEDNENIPSESDGEPAVIETGNGTSTATGATGANITDIDTNTSSSTASSTPKKSNGDTNIDTNQNVLGTTTSSSLTNTGENVAKDPDGSFIETGDGNASAFDAFFFNIALVDSNLQIEILLNPSEDELDFTERLISFFSFKAPEGDEEKKGCIPFYNCKKEGEINATTTNSADLNRTMYVDCNSGLNEGGYMATGDCAGSGVMVNMGNWFVFNSNLMVLLVNQVGDLNADIILPEPEIFEGLRGGSVARGSDLTVEQNANVDVGATSTAKTDANKVVEGAITGDADADAGVYNLLNQLNPPTCFIVSVGGKWNGDIYQLPKGFESAEAPFGTVVCGRGTGVGSAKEISAIVKQDLNLVIDAIVSSNTGGNEGQGAITGDADAFLAILNAGNFVFANADWTLGLFTVSGNWNGDLTFGARPDASPAEETAGSIISSSFSSGGGKKVKKDEPKITLRKTASVSTTTTAMFIDYTITINNNGAKAFDAMVRDLLYGPTDKIEFEHVWDLVTINAREEIVIKYTVELTGGYEPGLYTNTAELRASKYRSGENGVALAPLYASTTVSIEGGLVLGTSDCRPLLWQYLRKGGVNDPGQVQALRRFLNTNEGETLPILGVFDDELEQAVMRFQTTYQEGVLLPWGINEPTGYVYYTTRKKINELYCEQEFPLQLSQLQEIERYKKQTSVFDSNFNFGTLMIPAFAPVEIIPFSFSELLARVLKDEPTPAATGRQVSLFTWSIESFFRWLGTSIFIPVNAAEVNVTNSSSVTNSVSASASSGGQSVSGNGSIKTKDSSASVYTEVTSDDEGTEVYIEKTENGETTVESYTKDPGEPVMVNIEATAQSGGSKGDGEYTQGTSSVDASASTTASTTNSAEASVVLTWSAQLFQGISKFFNRLFSWL